MGEFAIDGPGLYMTESGFFVEIMGRAKWIGEGRWVGINGSGGEIDQVDLYADDGSCMDDSVSSTWRITKKVAAA